MEDNDQHQLCSLSINLLGIISHKNGVKQRPVFGVKFCHLVPSLYHHLVAVGGNRMHVYEAHEKGLDLVQQHTDDDVDEELYACSWAVRNNRPVVVAGGSRGKLHISPLVTRIYSTLFI
ncbi:hypothetical protein EON65_25975 [archaeon]|nr:MAG: hypothetical protein EON65_25975 [archaeon]